MLLKIATFIRWLDIKGLLMAFAGDQTSNSLNRALNIIITEIYI